MSIPTVGNKCVNNKVMLLTTLIIGILIENSMACKQFGEACNFLVPKDCCVGNICAKTNTTDPKSWKCAIDNRCTQPHNECGPLEPPCCTGYECISSTCQLKGQQDKSSSGCKKMGSVCNPKDKDCCGGLTCGITNANDPNSWECIIKTCQGLDENCGLGFSSCCSGYQCSQVIAGFVANCQLKKEEKKEEKKAIEAVSTEICLAKRQNCYARECCSGLRCALTRSDLNDWTCVESSCIEEGQPCGLLHHCCEGLECGYNGISGLLSFKGKCNREKA